MKKLITLVLIAISAIGQAQWSTTSNQFYDSLHMPVSNVVLGQRNPIILNSYPDGGYFVIWEDDRNTAATKIDIYAQKYNAAGNRVWAENGIPVANGPNSQRYTFSSNQDYRSRSYAATDSAGGFYLTYIDDSVTNYSWERIAVQHMLSNGNRVFGNVGFLVAQTPPGLNFTFGAPLLIPDGKKGFFIAYKNANGNDYINVYCYKDVNGVMTQYGGGRVNENAIQTSSIAPCGIKTDVVYPGTTVIDYNIWPDGQGGCNVIMSMNGNTGSQYKMLCYNRVWRAKKDSKVKDFYRNETGVACPRYTDYKNGDVYILYTIHRDFQSVACGGSGGPLYQYTNYRLLSNGYQLIDEGGYDYNYPKGTTVITSGNINVDLIAVTKRTYANNVVSNFTVQGYAYSSEKHDSVPYQRAANTNPEIGYNVIRPVSMDNLAFFRDTLLASGNYYPDFSLAGGGVGVGGNHIYAGALMSVTGDRLVRLQHLSVEKTGAKSFALKYETSTKYGEVIGKEINTGFSGYNISYDMPFVTVNTSGRALFHIREYYRSARVSPINNGAELAWGAMGKPVGTGVFNGNFYNLEQPVVALHPTDGSGVVAWRDNRNVPGATGENIFMLHIDSMNKFNYMPPNKLVKLMPNPYGGSVANPIVLMGTTKQYSTVEVYGTYSGLPVTSPVAEILDNYNLGNVGVNVFQNSGALRRYNGQPYLNRNYTIIVENKPAGGAAINVRLFFTTEEFDLLKAADNSVKTPADLIVIQQPNNVLTAIPNVYSPVGGEQVVRPIAWKAVPGGFYLEISVKSFSNFFIQKAAASALCKSGNTSITSNLAGASYQWQVNTGGGFANIANSSFYSGTNTVTLALSNVPTSWYGYEYRCVVDGNNSYAVTLQFVNTWTGAVNSNWETAGNWSCGVVPDANTDVVINGGSPVLNSNAPCRSLYVNPGATFTVVKGYKLTVTH
jgi:hypothetical protein